jgi:hypothetical protein
VRRYLHGQYALGRVIHLLGFLEEAPGKPGDTAASRPVDDAFTIVGVIQDIPLAATFHEDFPQVFVPWTVLPGPVSAMVFTELPAGELARPMQEVVASIDKDQPVTDVMSLREMLNKFGYSEARFTLALFGSFAVAALVLSLVGIYGVVSFITSERTQEIGIRMALGAMPGGVMWMVLRQSMLLAAGGVAIGLPLSWFAGRFAQDELVHTSQHDPLALLAAVVLLPLLALAGAWFPALRAAAVDPVRALRND